MLRLSRNGRGGRELMALQDKGSKIRCYTCTSGALVNQLSEVSIPTIYVVCSRINQHRLLFVSGKQSCDSRCRDIVFYTVDWIRHG